jgi:hypothetical protein
LLIAAIRPADGNVVGALDDIVWPPPHLVIDPADILTNDAEGDELDTAHQKYHDCDRGNAEWVVLTEDELGEEDVEDEKGA